MNTSEIKKIWENVKEELKQVVPESAGPWIKSLEAISFEGNQFTLISGASFGIDYLKRTYYQTFLDTFKKVLNQDIIVNFEFDEDLAKRIKKERATELKKFEKKKQEEVEHIKALKDLDSVRNENIILRYRFDNFVTDENNKIAKAAAQQVAENPTNLYNPLYIQGGSGLGKTHLMQAIRAHVIRKGLKVRCIKTEDFINEYINSTCAAYTKGKSTTSTMNKFRNRYRDVDILLIDDIQFIENKQKCMEELFNTLDTLYNANKQIVLTSDKLPKDLPEIPTRLRTRFEQGLIVEINPPKYETRVKILENFAKEKGFENLSQEVFDYIAKYKKDNVRELEGAFIKVSAYSSFEQEPITLKYAQKVLKLEDQENKPTIEKVANIIADYFDVTVENFLSSARTQAISDARAIVCYIAREYLQLSYESIAYFLNKKHQTVMYSAEKIKKALKTNNELEKNLNKILKKLGL